MPIYEYGCKKCGAVTEVLQKASDPPPKKCACGSKRLSKLMSQTSFVLKGTGWYVTDFAGKGKKDGGKNDDAKKGEAKKGKSSEASGDKGDSAKSKKKKATASKNKEA